MGIRKAFGNHAEDSTEISSIIDNRIFYKKLPDEPTYPCSSYFIVIENIY